MPKFVWYELMTSDAAGAAAFYGSVVGWQAADSGMPGANYSIFSLGEVPIAGLMATPSEQPASRPIWTGYVGVDDVDAYATRVTSAGGRIFRAPEDIPTVGRFAVAGDTAGAAFMLFRPTGESQPSPPAGTPGLIGWHELQATELSDFALYENVFGWTKTEAVDMGPLGLYQMFATGAVTDGGIMKRSADLPVPFWLFYFNVAHLDVALAAVTSGDGQVLNGPQSVGGGSWIAQCLDPQGAMFALNAPVR